jgi:glycosyltransferase involved in cell wall biosynthesis
MRIAYVTTHESSDVEAWSGLSHHIRQALCQTGLDVCTIDNVSPVEGVISLIKRLYCEKVELKRFHAEREPSSLRVCASQVESALASLDCDVVFSPGTLPIAFLKTEKPIVFWTDSPFAGMVDFYPNYRNLCKASLRAGNEVEQRALNQCRLAIYSSEWAASTALRHYRVDEGRVKVVPFGANVDGLQCVDEVARITAAKNRDVCRLLFVGVDWARKAGDFAVSVAEHLAQSTPVELHIVGCVPPRRLPDFVTVHGYLSKATEPDAEALSRLFRASHFLIHPSRAECYGLALAEASAFGLPALTANVGGTSSVITDGVNGHLFNLDEGPSAYCACVQRLFASRDDYDRLALSSFKEYQRRLNWTVAGRRVRELIEEAAAG